MSALKIIFTSVALMFITAACSAQTTQTISPKDAEKYIGKTATVCGLVASATYMDRRSKITLLNLDKAFPDNIFTAVIYSEDRPKFGEPEKACLQKNICVTGEITKFRDKPQIVVKEKNQLKGC